MSRHVPLIVISCAASALAENVADQLRREGNVVYVTHSPEGCLRVATSVGPDVILLDRAFPARTKKLLKAHPMSARALMLHVSDDQLSRVASQLRTTLTAGPHAA